MVFRRADVSHRLRTFIAGAKPLESSMWTRRAGREVEAERRRALTVDRADDLLRQAAHATLAQVIDDISRPETSAEPKAQPEASSRPPLGRPRSTEYGP